MEQRVAPVLERYGYMVTPNDEYEDPDTGKSREIDIHALSMRSLYRREFQDLFNVVILGACRNNELPVVAFSSRNFGLASINELPVAGYPQTIAHDEGTERLDSYLSLDDRLHFYTAKRVATQYCRLAHRSGVFVADHGDLYSDLDSLVKAVAANIADWKVPDSRLPELDLSGTEDDVNLAVIFPVVIFAGDLYECWQTKTKVHIRPVNHVVFLRRISARGLKGEFFVDFVRESYLRKFLSLIDREVDWLERRLRSKRVLLRQNVMRELREATASLHLASGNIPLAMRAATAAPLADVERNVDVDLTAGQ
jgi:hypothetical protein